MTANRTAPRKILAVAEPGETQIALAHALALADAHGATLEVIACVELPHDLSILSRLSGEDPERLIDEAVERTRTEVEARLRNVAPNRAITPTVTVGKAYLQIIRHVARSGCDFVIKKAERLSGMDRFLFASTDQHLLRKCPCPVWLQTAAAPKQPKRILAAVDLDVSDAEDPKTLADLNRRVIDAACVIAGGEGAEVIVLHAWDAIGEGMVWAFSGGHDSRLSAELDPRPRLIPHLVRGAPETVIHEQSRAAAADVVVMGTVARTGLNGVFIGNTAENIINSLECPVLAVKPDGFISPLLRT